MFECVVCSDRTSSFRYSTRYDGDFVPLCSRRCWTVFLDEPSQFLPVLEELQLVG